MGITIAGRAVLGIEIPTHKLYVKTKVKTFDHDFPDDFTHDPRSGRPLWKEQTSCIPEFDEVHETLCGFKIHRAYDRGHHGETARTVVGICETYATGGNNDCMFFVRYDLVLKAVEEHKERLKDALIRLGLWDDRKFGMYSVTYVS